MIRRPRSPALLALSIGLHLALLLGGHVRCAGEPPEKGGDVSSPPPDRAVLMVPSDSGTLACRASYVGIGVWISTRQETWGRVLDVATNGPADHVDIRVGDSILNPSVLWQDAEEGTLLRLEVRRGATEFTRLTRVGKICYT